MAILFSTTFGDVDEWVGELGKHLSDDEIRVYPEVGDPADIEFAVLWDIPLEALASLPNLRALLLLGSGGSHLRPVEALPDVPIVRLVDDAVADDMAAYALHWIIHFHRNMHLYRQQQSNAEWTTHGYGPTDEHTVGVLGFGNIGRRVADRAQALGYPIRGWSRSPKEADGVDTFTGVEELDAFLGGTRVLVNVLPLTSETRRLLNHDRLCALPIGATMVNMGRGGTVDDEAMLAVLDNGHLAGVALDVFREEPLGPDSPFWTHPKVAVTPHVSGAAQPRSSVRYIAANIERIRRGEEAYPLFDPARGY